MITSLMRSTDFSNGKYVGDVSNRKPSGLGYFLYNNGNSYKGNFVDGRKQGENISVVRIKKLR